jgi:acid ceramidase
MLNLLVLTTARLEPTQVNVVFCSEFGDWTVDFPRTVKPDTVHLDFSVSSPSFSGAGRNLSFAAHGSLGLPNHPLGIFRSTTEGVARGDHPYYIYDGVLGVANISFPATWSDAGAAIKAHVDVWTVIPSIPPAVSTGFTFEMTLQEEGNTLLCVRVELSQPKTSSADKDQDKCLTSESDIPNYPPTTNMLIPEIEVDLDAPPATRWNKAMKPFAPGMKALVESFLEFLPATGIVNGTLFKTLLAAVARKEMPRMPAEFVSEMKGIALATGVSIGYILVINMMYEITGACTSVVAQDAQGQVWHGRNLDFGLFMGTNSTTHTWVLTQRLRDVLVNVKFTRGGSVVYESTTYAGFIGLLSGSRPGAFSISVDTRFDANIDRGWIGWMLGKNDDCQFLTFQTRMVMETNTTYSDALDSIVGYKAMGPAYVIMAGAASGEGAVIAKQFNASAERAGQPWANHDVWHLSEEIESGSFYVLETNYDRKKAPAEFDDRRYPAMNCLDGIGADGLTDQSLWAVMSSNPTSNAATTFTSIISPAKGYYKTYQQYCVPGLKCMPF